jgi:broad specificity phosphatase PhoE
MTSCRRPVASGRNPRQHLAELGISFDRCLAGDLRRQQHTATSALEQFTAVKGCRCPSLETDSAFNEFDAEAVIRALLPAMLPDEPEALDILRNAAQNRAEFQRMFALIIERWLAGDLRHAGAGKLAGFRRTASRPGCTGFSTGR